MTKPLTYPQQHILDLILDGGPYRLFEIESELRLNPGFRTVVRNLIAKGRLRYNGDQLEAIVWHERPDEYLNWVHINGCQMTATFDGEFYRIFNFKYDTPENGKRALRDLSRIWGVTVFTHHYPDDDKEFWDSMLAKYYVYMPIPPK
jgi:hypothetical protein